MTAGLAYLWNHPRRTGFIAFNLIVVAVLFGWGWFTDSMTREGLGGVPNVMLGFTGMALLLVAWVVAWIAWAAMVVARHARLKQAERNSAQDP